MSNEYDNFDIVRREAVIVADGSNGYLKIAAYRVRDPETNEFSKLQFHATFNNTVLAVMGEGSAKLFARFINTTIKEQS